MSKHKLKELSFPEIPMYFHSLRFAKPFYVLSGRDRKIKSSAPLLKELANGSSSQWTISVTATLGYGHRLPGVCAHQGETAQAGHCRALVTRRWVSVGFSFRKHSNIERPLPPGVEAGHMGISMCFCMPGLEVT